VLRLKHAAINHFLTFLPYSNDTLASFSINHFLTFLPYSNDTLASFSCQLSAQNGKRAIWR